MKSPSIDFNWVQADETYLIYREGQKTPVSRGPLGTLADTYQAIVYQLNKGGK